MLKRVSFFVLIMLVAFSFCGCNNELRLITTSQIENIVISDGSQGIRFTGEQTIDAFYQKIESIYVCSNRFIEQENGNKYYGEMVLKIEVDATRDREFRFDIVKVGEGSEKKYYIQKIYNEKYYLSDELSQEMVDYFYGLYYNNTIVID